MKDRKDAPRHRFAGSILCDSARRTLERSVKRFEKSDDGA